MAFVYGSTFRLDDRGEVIIEAGGDISLVTEYDKVIQDLSVILRSQKKQYLFNNTFGVDYIQYLNGSSTHFITKEITEAIQSYYFVTRINTLDISFENKKINIKADMLLANGNNISINMLL